MAERSLTTLKGTEDRKVPDGYATDFRYSAPCTELVKPQNPQYYAIVMHLLMIYCYISEKVPDAYNDDLMRLLRHALLTTQNSPSAAYKLISHAAKLLKGLLEPALWNVTKAEANSVDYRRKIMEYLSRNDLSDMDVELKEYLDLTYSKEVGQMVQNAFYHPAQLCDILIAMKASEEKYEEATSKQDEELKHVKRKLVEQEKANNELRKDFEDFKRHIQDECRKERDEHQQVLQKEQECHRKQIAQHLRYRGDLEKRLRETQEDLERECVTTENQKRERDELLRKEKRKKYKYIFIFIALVVSGAIIGGLAGLGIGAYAGASTGVLLAGVAAGGGIGATVGGLSAELSRIMFDS